MSLQSCELSVAFYLFASIDNVISRVYSLVDYELPSEVIDVIRDKCNELIPEFLTLLYTRENF